MEKQAIKCGNRCKCSFITKEEVKNNNKHIIKWIEKSLKQAAESNEMPNASISIVGTKEFNAVYITEKTKFFQDLEIRYVSQKNSILKFGKDLRSTVKSFLELNKPNMPHKAEVIETKNALYIMVTREDGIIGYYTLSFIDVPSMQILEGANGNMWKKLNYLNSSYRFIKENRGLWDDIKTKYLRLRCRNNKHDISEDLYKSSTELLIKAVASTISSK